jgi:hypothetical protein
MTILWDLDVRMPGGELRRWSVRAGKEGDAVAQVEERLPVGAEIVGIRRARVAA